MHMPKSIKFMGYRIRIAKVDESNHPDASGSYNQWFGLIRIVYASEQLEAATLLHEIVEMINTNFELALEHPKINQLADALFHVLRDNKLDFRDRSK